ncbi:SUKH-4 family immunity protein [Streptomyces gobiensis]|uniref:SUKH-4 family immunity protein n=1 Tax=Streptomyces gobiensis TaxID=2875706 RepID=UPI001E45A0B9|nr:SUKH-4 family immunity protein [Streptomyces gobiensis]UGY91846.1 SUKH-4 family immunity protein [Streptomyces gobiensis]
MVTFAQAQERAERWINGGVPGHQHREVRVREFDLGFVAWAEDRGTVPASDGGNARLLIARDSGDSTLWPGLPVGEVIRRYEEQYGPAAGGEPAAAVPPQRVDLEATSFLLTPPEWLQEAADRMGVPGRRESASAWADTSSSGSGESLAPPATVFAPPISGSDDDDTPPPPSAGSEAKTALLPEGSALPKTQVAPALEEPQPPQQTPRPPGGGMHHAATMLADPGSGGLPPVPPPPAPGPPGQPGQPGAADIADADTSRAPRGGVPPRPSAPSAPQQAARPSRGSGPSVPPPPGAPGTPGARPKPATSGPGAPGSPGAGYVPTQLVSAEEVAAQGQSDAPPSPPSGSDASSGGGVHHAATMLADPGSAGQPPVPPPSAPGQPGQPGQSGGPGTPSPPGPPGPPSQPSAPGGGVHQAATMLASPGGPSAPPPPNAPQPPAMTLGAAGAGYPQQPPTGQPTVGPGYMAVLRYRAPDGSEQQLIRRSAPGAPHPEWQILHELRGLNVPPQQVLELHTELESCDLPGGYCARMIRETWPQVRITNTAAYGREHASRQQGVRHLVEHQGELHQVADGPARPAPVRVPLQQVPPAPPIPPDGIGQELAQAFGPQGIFRFDQRAVSRQGVPDIVAHTLVWAGLPVDFGPFFWAQAQPDRPVPTLAELAQERGVQPASDAGSYLVMGSDFGRQLCVQYGTAHIVAVPLEAGPGGQPVPPQFVNTGLPEFARCLALLGRMWRLRYGLTPEQAGHWTVDFQNQLSALDPAALSGPENWWSVLLEQMWDGLL